MLTLEEENHAIESFTADSDEVLLSWLDTLSEDKQDEIVDFLLTISTNPPPSPPPVQFADFYDLAGRLEYAAKKPSSTAPKKKNCTKGVYCIGKTGKGSCVKAGSKCRSKANQKSKDYTAAIGPEPGKKATAPKTEVAPTEAKLTPAQKGAATKAKNKAAKEVALKAATPVTDGTAPAAKPATEPKKTAAPKASHPDYQPFVDMANGKHPDEIKLTAEQTKAAMDWMETGGNNNKKVKMMQKEAGDITHEEGSALGNWLGFKYKEMSKRIWNPDALPKDQHEAALAADILAAKALHKVPPVTKDGILKNSAKHIGAYRYDDEGHTYKETEKTISDRLDKPLNRWMDLGDNVGAFVQKYKDALKGDGAITEDNFFGVSHLQARDMQFFSDGHNVRYEVTAKLDGTGQGRYTDHFKNQADEGEILFPPSSKFKVTKVVDPVGGYEPTQTEKKQLALSDKLNLAYATVKANKFGLGDFFEELDTPKKKTSVKNMSPDEKLKAEKLKSTDFNVVYEALHGTKPPTAEQLKEAQATFQKMMLIKAQSQQKVYVIHLQEV